MRGLKGSSAGFGGNGTERLLVPPHRQSLRGGIPPPLRAVAAGRHRAAVGALEEPAIAVILLQPKAAFVHQPMMASAQQQQVAEGGLAAGRPVSDVVRVHEAPAAATGKSATPVARPQGPFDGGRHGAGLAAANTSTGTCPTYLSRQLAAATRAPDTGPVSQIGSLHVEVQLCRLSLAHFAETWPARYRNSRSDFVDLLRCPAH